MRKSFFLILLLCSFSTVGAQRVLNLDSCRNLAMNGNNQLKAAKIGTEMAAYTRKAARTKYLPKVDALGGYEFFSKEVSILNNNQKNGLSNLGSNLTGKATARATEVITSLVQGGLISPEMAGQIGQLISGVAAPIAQVGNQIGDDIRDAFKTDTKHIWYGSVALRQPIFMGGAIKAANRMADIGEEMALNTVDMTEQATLHQIDNTYWTVVSLRQKLNLATSFRDLVKKLDDDVHKMIDEGVATKADGLKVDVKVNEADMAVLQVENGLALAKMLLCQLCGIPLDENIRLADEDMTDIPSAEYISSSDDENNIQRPELRLLKNAVEMSEQSTKLIRAAYLPHVALTGGYLISNPNVFNGFERKFSGVWNVGVMVQIPIWYWNEGNYKIRASKAATAMANLELNDVEEKIDLQVRQSKYRLDEANKRLATAQKNISSAEEILRCANIGFSEGVMESTDVMAAQTAWQQAQTQKIDAEIDVRLAILNLKKATGHLR